MIPVETKSIYQKLLEVQKKCAGTLKFDKVNPHFKNKYVSFETVINALLPELTAAGLVLIQKIGMIDGFWCVRTLVMDGSAMEELSCFPIINSKNDAQGFGSALSYAKRYSLLAAFSMVGGDKQDLEPEDINTDDDANVAVKKPKPKLGERYDESKEAKERLWSVMERYGMTKEQAKEVEPKLRGKSWIDCELEIDAYTLILKKEKEQ